MELVLSPQKRRGCSTSAATEDGLLAEENKEEE
jgi:hypothetical protein